MLRIPLSVWLIVLSVTVSRGTRGDVGRAGDAAPPGLRTGDLAFQASRSAQSRAIQQATASPWSHVGLVEVADDGVYVVEAAQVVSRTPWRAWVRRGERGEALVLRPRGLAPDGARAALAEARRHLGKPYDPGFGWDDDRMYCSELVRKALFRGAGLEVGRMERLGALRLSGLLPAIEARWGRVPAELLLVTPASLARDPRMQPVWEGRG